MNEFKFVIVGVHKDGGVIGGSWLYTYEEAVSGVLFNLDEMESQGRCDDWEVFIVEVNPSCFDNPNPSLFE